MLYSFCFPKPAFFPLISFCKALCELPQYLQSSLASPESFSHVPQELSWLVMPHGTSHLMPSVPVRWHSPWLSCSFDVWTAFSFILPSLLGPHSSPLSCLPFLLAQVLQLLLFPSEAGSNLTLLWAGGWPKGCQTSLSASVIMWIHEDSCNLLNPWWNSATHMSPPCCTPPPAPSQDRHIQSAMLVSADPLLGSTVLSAHLPEVGVSSSYIFCGFTTFLHQFSDLQPRSVTTHDSCWWPEQRPGEGGFSLARSDDPLPEPHHRELCAGHHCWPARCFQSGKAGARNSLLLLLPWKPVGAS